ncbi:hypothetical protein DPMN_014108 [Dreissena polymorpha]|uniref:Uncharacterized protein n=1 Tax=Dreissena polymorpha TaxID=45954 RepID=A0A9D4S494_DREPO|nr:hypothetical protein DPMN_014108 [Dreissena polymorpha]
MEATNIITCPQLETMGGNLHHNVSTVGDKERQLASCVNSCSAFSYSERSPVIVSDSVLLNDKF